MTGLKKKVRVLIVEDSAFMRKVLHDIIAADPTMEVAGQAKDGREGVSLAESLQPDVITMDINMPRLDGLGATEADHVAKSAAHRDRQFGIARRHGQHVCARWNSALWISCPSRRAALISTCATSAKN